MSRSRSLLVLLAAGVFAACNSAASGAPGSSTGTGGGANGTPQPAASQPGGGPGGTQAATADFGPAANALDNLDSYKFDVEISTSSSSAFGSEGTTSFTGVVVNKPDKEQLLDQVSRDANGNVTSELHFLVIGEQGWTKENADGTYVALPAGAATGMLSGLTAFQPQKLFGIWFGSLGSDYQQVGTESKNGVDTNHYHGDESIGTVFSALAGVSGQWTSDVWLATEGGYLVSSNVSASGADATSAGNFKIDVEITNVNDPANKLTPPS